MSVSDIQIKAGNDFKSIFPITPSQGGTGLKTSPQAITNLASNESSNIFIENPSIGVTGILPISNGGTGLSASPSLITNLSSNNPESLFQENPRPGVTGILPLANGGTGINFNPYIQFDLSSNDSVSLFDASNSNITPGVTGTLPISKGGTGATTESNARTNLGINTYVLSSGGQGSYDYNTYEWSGNQLNPSVNSKIRYDWIKYSNGLAVMSVLIRYSKLPAYSALHCYFTLPFAFTHPAIVNAGCSVDSDNACYMTYVRGASGSVDSYLYRSSTSTSVGLELYYIVSGCWDSSLSYAANGVS
jgi:hypothetical protein